MHVPSWDTEEGLRMWQAGCTAAEIAETLGTTFSAVKNWADTSRAAELRAKGMKYKEIAETLGTTEKAVEAYLRAKRKKETNL